MKGMNEWNESSSDRMFRAEGHRASISRDLKSSLGPGTGARAEARAQGPGPRPWASGSEPRLAALRARVII